MTALSFFFLFASAAEAGLHPQGEAPELASMALLSVILAGASVLARRIPHASRSVETASPRIGGARR